MSYEPTQWSAGDTVTSAKLNKIEQGIAANGEILLVHTTLNGDNLPTLDKTWQEIHDADICYIIYRNNESSACILVMGTSIYEGEYTVGATNFQDLQVYVTDSPNNYPTRSMTPIPGDGSNPT